MADRKVSVVLESIGFSFYVYIPLFLHIVSLHTLRLENETNIPFDLIKNTYFHFPDCKTPPFYLVTSGGA